MSEYIACDAAIAIIEEKQKELCPVGRYSRHYVYGTDRERFDAWQEIIDALEDSKTADVEEVVRYKDCKHWQRHTGVVDSPNGHCFALETCTNGNDFCSYGERQANGGADNATD